MQRIVVDFEYIFSCGKECVNHSIRIKVKGRIRVRIGIELKIQLFSSFFTLTWLEMSYGIYFNI
jgi:hypothetical protein